MFHRFINQTFSPHFLSFAGIDILFQPLAKEKKKTISKVQNTIIYTHNRTPFDAP